MYFNFKAFCAFSPSKSNLSARKRKLPKHKKYQRKKILDENGDYVDVTFMKKLYA